MSLARMLARFVAAFESELRAARSRRAPAPPVAPIAASAPPSPPDEDAQVEAAIHRCEVAAALASGRVVPITSRPRGQA